MRGGGQRAQRNIIVTSHARERRALVSSFVERACERDPGARKNVREQKSVIWNEDARSGLHKAMAAAGSCAFSSCLLVDRCESNSV